MNIHQIPGIMGCKLLTATGRDVPRLCGRCFCISVYYREITEAEMEILAAEERRGEYFK